MLIGVKDSQSDLEKHYKTFCGLYCYTQKPATQKADNQRQMRQFVGAKTVFKKSHE